jgi:hypothetical protein
LKTPVAQILPSYLMQFWNEHDWLMMYYTDIFHITT